MSLIEKIRSRVIGGELDSIGDITEEALTKHGLDEIINDGLGKGMDVVGEKFQNGEYFLPEMIASAETMKKAFSILKPLIEKSNYQLKGVIVFGTVTGDLHDIGKNLVCIMLRGAGFEVIDLGNDVSPERFVDTAVEGNADIIGMSALLTTTMPVMKKVIDLARERQIYGRKKIIVGGAPLSQEYANEIGADAYCFDGVSAVEQVKKFLGRV